MTYQQFSILVEKNPKILKDSTAILARRFKVSEEVIKEFRRKIRVEKEAPTVEELEAVNFKVDSKIPEVKNGFSVSSFKQKGTEIMEVWYKKEESEELNTTEIVTNYTKEFLEIVSNNRIKFPVLKPILKSNGDTLLIINAADIHLNKKDFKKNITLEEQIETFEQAVLYLFEKGKQIEKVDKVLLIIGHDFYNSEITNATTKGTPQINIGNHKDLFKLSFSSLVKLINTISETTSIDVINCNGNHSYFGELQLAAALEVYFETNYRVSIISGLQERFYYRYDNNAFLLVHDFKKKVSEMPLVFALEEPVMFAECNNRFVLTGHRHGLKGSEFATHNEDYGITWIQACSLSNSDKWHDDNMYIGNKQRMLGMIIHKEQGLLNQFYFNK